ncbi:TetR/AcrR family transcriptional regulator [Corynebacterium sp.]|uniref:TetR/AcrR family transcriptional regulator n=1 Tax=Corynebacterium sp. TaxID=1720 RepID=UPI0025C20F7C|nr:TetR/AcrR family transcriptional regulator [Corynebacterium sp.]
MARRVDPEEVERKKAVIAGAAASLFAARGYENTSVAQIAAEVGTSPASVFYYFPDKASLFRAPFEQDVPAAERLIARYADAPDALGAVLEVVDALAGEAAHPHAQGLMVESLRRMSHDPELIAVAERAAEIQRAGLAALIAQAIRDGRVDPRLDADSAAQWLLAIVDACFLNAVPGRSPSSEVRRTVLGYLKGPHHE